MFSSAHAHEVRPAYLEIKETAPGQFSVLWRTPVLAGMRLPIVLKLPDDVRNLKEPVVQELTDSLVERRWIAAGPNGFAGKRIEFPGLQLTITDVLVRFEMLDGTKGAAIVRPSQPWMEMAATQTRWNVAGTYLRLGIEHIWGGIDHLLFVLALLLLVRGWRRVVATITAFTVAHSITLAAATLGFVHVPQTPVEATIALSIVFVAAEIVHGRQGKPGLTARWPWVIAFAFGLLHGFGFASALNQVGLPQNAIPVALLFFNLGVEAGQLLFIAAVLVVVGLARKATRHSTLDIRHPLSLGLARAALCHRQRRRVLVDPSSCHSLGSYEMKNMMHNRRTMFFLLLLWPVTAFAHTGGGEAIGFRSGLEHPLSGLDHILAMVAVGMELPPGANGVLYSIGFVITTGALHAVGIGIGTVHRWPQGPLALRVACGATKHILLSGGSRWPFWRPLIP